MILSDSKGKMMAIITTFLSAILISNSASAQWQIPSEWQDTISSPTTEIQNPFPDVDSDSPEGQAVIRLSEMGIVEGINGKWEGDKNVNRAEMVKLLIEARFGEKNLSQNSVLFTDVPQGLWYEKYVATAVEQNIVQGYRDNTFRAQNMVTTAEFMSLAQKTFSIDAPNSEPFRDVSEDDWFARGAQIAFAYDLFPERTTFFRPHQPLTRDQIAFALFQYLSAIAEEQKNEEQPSQTSPEQTPNDPVQNDAQENDPENQTEEDPQNTNEENEQPSSEESEESENTDTTDSSSIIEEKESEALVDTSYVAGAEDIPIWTGTFRANSVRDMTIRSMVFTNLGTAQDADVQNVSLSAYQVGLGKTVVSAQGSMQDGEVQFFRRSGSVFIPRGAEMSITIRADIAPTLSAEQASLRLQLLTDQLDIEDSSGKPVAVDGAGMIGPQITLLQRGSLGPTASGSQMPDSRIIIEGSENIPVATFEIEAPQEGILVRDLVITIQDVNTSTLLGTDVANDSDAIESLTLYSENGAPILTLDGNPATTSAISSGQALFENLDISIERKEDFLLVAAATIGTIGDSTVAKSGMAFTLQLQNNDQNEIIGSASGQKYTSIFPNGSPLTSEPMYVLQNNLTIANVSQSNNLTNGTQQELMRFEVSKQESSSAFLHAVKAQISPSGSASIDNLGLYNRQNELIAFTKTPQDGNTYTFTIGEQSGGLAADNGLIFDTDSLSTFDGKQYDSIRSNTDFYTIRADITNSSGDDQIVTTLSVNGSEPGQSDESITWRDEEEEGFTINWIQDLENPSLTKIEHVID